MDAKEEILFAIGDYQAKIFGELVER